MLARKHAKVLMELKHSETIAGLSPAQLWEVLGNFEAQALQDGGWYDAIPHKGENVLGSRRTVLPGVFVLYAYILIYYIPYSHIF
jgi:hypothetical protein